ncbi:hypothetical protein [Nostoc sp. FACHB-857]|uniref:Uncharacterized protein n=1 Tax=Nostoc paludosum FACHB-159 TaxID=2692908 RepID=A0ABR8K9B8_9NOSO|nr:hypothetical protein [Nostoc sp. FACHB-857]MBD2735406.1 hypothetical protein [Nostoc paludosum FACHB-159]
MSFKALVKKNAQAHREYYCSSSIFLVLSPQGGSNVWVFFDVISLTSLVWKDLVH